MKFKEFKGFTENKEQYHIIVNADFDISTIRDESGNKYEFVKNVSSKGEIKSWKPFIANYKSYEGNLIEVYFSCEKCGSRNCERENHIQHADPYLFQGSFKCSNCGTKGFNFYSDCFMNKSYSKQLSLF